MVRARYARAATLAGLAFVGLMAGCTSGGRPVSAADASSSPGTGGGTAANPGTAQGLQVSLENVVTQVLPSVVEITSQSGLGSGIVYDRQGNIVTNAHVVGTGTTFQVTLATGGGTHSAHLVSAYPPDDLAVIKLDSAPSTLRPATFADSSKLRVGQLVVAMGNPLGLSGSVTDGIISGIGRTVTEPQSADSPGATISDAVQTSAAINPGNSGGALVDLNGQVVGVPTLAATEPQQGGVSGGVAPGIGFAIPSNTVSSIAGQIVKNGKVVASGRAALDVTVQAVVDNSGQPAGAGVVQVAAGGAAAKAGIRPGDIITGVAGTATPDTATLSQVLASHKPGDTVSVSLLRPDGTKATVQVVLDQLR